MSQSHVTRVAGIELRWEKLRRVAPLPPYELDAALRTLEDAEFVVERTPYPEAEYAFKHPLTQEVAYRSQLADRRRRIHADVARAIADVYADRLDERAAILAHHWDEAGEGLEAARWHRRAAEWTAHNDTAAALRHWRTVRSLIAAFPAGDEAEGLALAACLGVLNLGPRHDLSDREAQALFDEGRTLAQHREDKRSLARLLLVFARFRGVSGDLEQASTLSLEAAKLAEQVGLTGLRLAATVNVSSWATQFGDLRRSLQIVEDALGTVPTNPRIGSEHLGYSPFIWLVMNRGRLLTYMGRCSDADVAFDRALRLSLDNERELEIACWTHQGYVDLAWVRGDPFTAIAHARSAVETAEKAGTLFGIWSSYHALGRAHILRNEGRDAVVALNRTVAVMRERRTGLHLEALVLASLAEAHLVDGDYDRALRIADEAVDAARRVDPTSSLAAGARTILARVRRETGQGSPVTEQRDLERALEVIAETGYASLAPPVHIELAELAKARDDLADAARHFERAKELYEAMGAPLRVHKLEERTMNVRMVVTGQTTDGKSVFVSDEEVPPITLSLVPGMESHRLWGADDPPSLPTDGSATKQPAFFPPNGGYRLLFTSLPPQGAGELPPDVDIEKGLAEFEEKVPGMAAQMEPDNPGMHTTDSVDFDIVLSGEVWLELDDGAEVQLKAGDVVVQNGTRHRWTNKGDVPVTFASVLVGLKRN